jgi:hypothetical protein
MPKGPQGQKRPADVIRNIVRVCLRGYGRVFGIALGTPPMTNAFP